ncbi:hypothetical protein [Pseudonocardia asaccharolytica]|uniref:DUF4386 domain-containing protein n=1 Tax=Pseudonocardia asaccharolytica DSM 44247 = NBRC 16224 TaxID=1123024 RepID=A0A511CV79_9PSEU|nr:hypothetical protein [Pseudonocardia asaccharolytica]GEL16485.1 hypothetical protein PA7_03220 [Pseudonocardia asaccharolytica DSM 44247 = NBRC 16224]
MATGDLYDFKTGVVADNGALAAAVAERATLVWVQQAVCAVVAACLVVFAAGLRRHLATQEPAGGLVSQIAASGIVLTAVALLVGSGISTELYWALTGAQPVDPDTIGAHVAIYNTMAWLWGGLALSAGAVALGGLRRGSVGRVVALFSALMALLLAATQVLPVQYIAVVPGALWLIGTGAALARRTARP